MAFGTLEFNKFIPTLFLNQIDVPLETAETPAVFFAADQTNYCN
jgi:hypothetical protein